MNTVRIVVATLFAGAFSASAIAQSQPAGAVAPMDCECRAMGQSWRQGAELCMNGSVRSCGMDQNVSTWVQTGKSCPIAIPNGSRRISTAENQRRRRHQNRLVFGSRA